MSKRCCAESCFNSKLINKNVSYFGFPKYEEFAVKWAIAANRADLLEKKIACITKYYLCSEHFTDDCFVDPPYNTRLNKTLYPLNIPVPTIFKCNIEKYIPNTKRRRSESDDAEDSPRVVKKHSSGSTSNDGSLMSKARDGISMESLSVFHDHYNYTDISNCSISLFNDISEGINDLSNENSFDRLVDCDLTNISNGIDDDDRLQVCRLCAETYPPSVNLQELSSIPDSYEHLNALLPNLISSNDNLSQVVCTNCIEKLSTCIRTLSSFREAQIQLRDNS